MTTTDAALPRTGTDDPAAGLPVQRTPLPTYDAEIGPLAHLAAERARLAGLTWQHIEVAPVSATIGAEVSGVDLTQAVPAEVIAELRQALVDFKVLFFRDQPISAASHVDFARAFGELEVHPFIQSNDEFPELVRFEKSADVAGYENIWHSDVSWRERPSMGTILHAIDLPPTGGDTLFADMAAVYDGLPADLRARVDDLTAIHDFTMAFGFGLDEASLAEMRALHPPVEHPVIRTLPDSGRRVVYVNQVFTREIVGLDPDESRGLVDRLCRDVMLPEYQCRFRWEPDSIAFWDNRAVQHYACSDYWPEVRVMERASITGERPV